MIIDESFLAIVEDFPLLESVKIFICLWGVLLRSTKHAKYLGIIMN